MTSSTGYMHTREWLQTVAQKQAACADFLLELKPLVRPGALIHASQMESAERLLLVSWRNVSYEGSHRTAVGDRAKNTMFHATFLNSLSTD